MTNPFPSNNNKNPFPSNINQSYPKNLEDLNAELGEYTDEIEDVKYPEKDLETVKILQRSFLALVAIGLVVGIFVAAGVLYVMDRFNITASPQQIEQMK